MIQPEVQEVASVFRGELRWMFGPYPKLIPDMSWPSVGILDALCRGLIGRGNWSEGEKVFISGAAAHIGELVERSWCRFASDVSVEAREGVICSARTGEDSTYMLPLELGLKATLRDPSLARRIPVELAYKPPNSRHAVELFGLTACLGLNVAGMGTWSGSGAEPERRIDAAVPLLAEMCASHYTRLHPHEPVGQRAAIYRPLIWPFSVCDGAKAYKDSAASLLTHLDNDLSVIRNALPPLSNLARFPLSAVRSAALTCLSVDERTPLSGELIEIAADHFRDRAWSFRTAAIKLAAAHGRSIDWLRGGPNAEARFRFERRLSLIPLVYLSFETSMRADNRDLVSALVANSAQEASSLLERRLVRGVRTSELMFQQAILKRTLGDLDEAEMLMTEVVRNYPEALNGEFYLEAGVNALEAERYDDAVARLERARSLGNGLRVSTNLGRAYASAGRHEEAEQVFAQAIARGHLPTDVLVNRADLKRQLGLKDGYSRDLAAAAALHPFNPRVVERVMASYVNA